MTRNQWVTTRAPQRIINKLDAWLVEKGLTFYTKKTINIIFGKRNEEQIEVTLRNKILSYKESKTSSTE